MSNTDIRVLENVILSLEQERSILVAKKKDLEIQLMEENSKLKTYLPDEEARPIINRRRELSKAMCGIESQMQVVKMKLREKQWQMDDLKGRGKDQVKLPILESLQALKANYMDFAQDRSRVSSMRAMAAKVADELDQIIKSNA